MSGTTPQRRVRHELRDGLLVMLCSLLASSGLVLVLTAVVHVGNQG